MHIHVKLMVKNKQTKLVQKSEHYIIIQHNCSTRTLSISIPLNALEKEEKKGKQNMQQKERGRRKRKGKRQKQIQTHPLRGVYYRV